MGGTRVQDCASQAGQAPREKWKGRIYNMYMYIYICIYVDIDINIYNIKGSCAAEGTRGPGCALRAGRAPRMIKQRRREGASTLVMRSLHQKGGIYHMYMYMYMCIYIYI